MKRGGGSVVSIAPDGKETLIWKGTQSEVNSAQPTTDDTFVTEAGNNPRLLEVVSARRSTTCMGLYAGEICFPSVRSSEPWRIIGVVWRKKLTGVVSLISLISRW